MRRGPSRASSPSQPGSTGGLIVVEQVLLNYPRRSSLCSNFCSEWRQPVSVEIADAVLIHKHVIRTEIHPDQIFIELTVAKTANSKRKQNGHNVLEVPWQKTSPTRRREVLVPETGRPHDVRPIRSEIRALLIASIAQGRRWILLCVSAIRDQKGRHPRPYAPFRGRAQACAAAHPGSATLPTSHRSRIAG